MRTLPYLFLFLIILSACGGDSSDEPADFNISADNEAFLNELIDLMRNNSISRDTIDWDGFRDEIFEAGRDSEQLNDLYPAIELALVKLGDGHSLFIAPNGDEVFDPDGPRCADSSIGFPQVPDNIGYISIPSFSGTSEEGKALAESLQETIRSQDSQDILGWIVDLRGNLGGNMWPMLVGVGPLLGEGVCGYFIDPDNLEIPWSYANGASTSGSTIRVAIADPYEVINSNSKIAVLLDQAVASSGEAIGISFVGRERTRSFGRATCGLSTSNRGFPMRNGSFLLLTGSFLADRNKLKYGVPLVPDEEIDQPATTLARAIEWILD